VKIVFLGPLGTRLPAFPQTVLVFHTALE
jgi:hypothetical protein